MGKKSSAKKQQVVEKDERVPVKNETVSVTNVSSVSNVSEDVRSRIALVMMVKNEEKRIEVSFDSVRPYANTFVILDTGSNDRTISICREYCNRHNITLFLKESPFVNFCVSRNVLLDFADECLDSRNKKFLLQLDCNDELRDAHNLVEFVKNFRGTQTGFYLKQQWWTGQSYDSYFNIRLVLSHSEWRYKAVVHEYICKKNQNDARDILRLENIVLFQDRTKDDDKSQKRFKRDKDMLYAEYLRDPKDPRTLFYLAQTCGCLGLQQEAYQYYILRSKLTGFVEEVYHAFYRLGELSMYLGHCWEESMSWFLKAYTHSKRAEPLVKIAEYYKDNNSLVNYDNNTKKKTNPDWSLCYAFASQACKLLYPHNQILFIDRQTYVYKRWHILGVAAYNVGRFKEGKEACIKAIQSENKDVDMDNLILYLKKEKEFNTRGASSLNWSELMIINIKDEDIIPEQERDFNEKQVNERDGLVVDNNTKEAVMKRALTKMLGK
jgi:glycosyltransferase involved in cell wall biosynthesis